MLLFAAVVAVVLYWRTMVEDTPGDYHVKTGNYRLQDGQYDRAIAEFELALEANADHPLAYLGIALALMHLERIHEASLEAFDHALALDDSLAVAYADRGHPARPHGPARLGRPRVQDYRRALALDPRLADGPGWLWRFLRNIPERPPTIADRAAYLEGRAAQAARRAPAAPAGDRRAAAHVPALR